jgi:serine/threonine protein kinase
LNPEPGTPALFELPRGTRVGKYEILRKLATGGMAEIYVARSTGTAGFEKIVVLKRILPSQADDPQFVAMFLEEARLAATLHHPNIADVHDVGEDNGTYFFTMEYVYGQDARAVRHETRRRNERIPLPVALSIISGAAAALAHAHAKKGPDGTPLHLVHRDVSASNIMLSYDGAIKLVDFGIARASTSNHKTQTGTLKGKVPYMSPEQCKGFPLDRRSDVFSLGIVMFELTTGQRPFRGGSDFAIMDMIVNGGGPKPSEIVADYPPALERMVMRLLERKPDDRYATADDFIAELDPYIADNGLWQSPRVLGNYMRELFADKIRAWEEAERSGVPFAQHVQESVTSESRRFDALTPPSAVKVQPNPMLSASESPTMLIEPTPALQQSPAAELPTEVLAPVRRQSSPALPVVGRTPSSPALQALSEPPVFAASSSPYPVVQRPAPEPTPATVGAVSPRWQRAMFIGLAGAFVLVVVVLLATC